MVTLRELDREIATCGAGWEETRRILEAVRPLVEEAECKARIEAAECDWVGGSGYRHSVWNRPAGLFLGHFDDLARAADAAEAQAAKRGPSFEKKLAELGAKHSLTKSILCCLSGVRMTAEDGEAFRFCRCGDGPDWQEQALAFAAAHRKPTERWSEPLQTLSFDEIKSICFELGGNPHPRWFLFAMGQLQTLAEVQGRYDPDTDRIRLPEVAA